jgi:hypothetical protein
VQNLIKIDVLFIKRYASSKFLVYLILKRRSKVTGYNVNHSLNKAISEGMHVPNLIKIDVIKRDICKFKVSCIFDFKKYVKRSLVITIIVLCTRPSPKVCMCKTPQNRRVINPFVTEFFSMLLPQTCIITIIISLA